MSSSNVACCVVHLNQQQERNTQHLKQLDCKAQAVPQDAPRKCTVVEDGRVVVRLVQPELD